MVPGLLFWVSLFILAVSWVAPAARAVDGTPDELRAYADPETGELVPAPVDTGAGTAAASDEPADLEIVPAPSVAGGVMVDLRGHFRHATRARAATDGSLSHQCAPNLEAGLEK
jgi:hypothetical protein